MVGPSSLVFRTGVSILSSAAAQTNNKLRVGVRSVGLPWGFGLPTAEMIRGHLRSFPLFRLAVDSKRRSRLDKGHRAPPLGCCWLAAGQMCRCDRRHSTECVGRVISYKFLSFHKLIVRFS